VSDQLDPIQCPGFGPKCSPTSTGTSPSPIMADCPSWRPEFLTAVPPSLTLVSRPQPRHRVRRVVFPLSDQLRRPWNCRSMHSPQLRRLHRRKKERPRPQPSTPPSLISPVRSRSHDQDCGIPLRTRAPYVRARLSAPASPGAGPNRSVRSPSVADAAGPPVSARPSARAPSAADLILAVGF
jgi:hypothetical protein